jgi:hypothetical protein
MPRANREFNASGDIERLSVTQQRPSSFAKSRARRQIILKERLTLEAGIIGRAWLAAYAHCGKRLRKAGFAWHIRGT